MQKGPKSVGHQVDAFGGTARPQHLVGMGGIQVHAQLLAGGFKGIRGPLAQGVHAPVHIGVVLPVIPVQRLQNGLRFLHGRCIVQIHQRMAMDRLAQNRKFF